MISFSIEDDMRKIKVMKIIIYWFLVNMILSVVAAQERMFNGSTIDRLCPDDLPAVQCFVNPCDYAICEAYPDATCEPNYCGGCYAEFYVGLVKVYCLKQIKLGSCPKLQITTLENITTSDRVAASKRRCVIDCDHDGDCDGTQKCCNSNDCDMKCTPPNLDLAIWGCFVDGHWWPVGSYRLWDCALCVCLKTGFVCLTNPGLICDPLTGPCPGNDDIYTIGNSPVFCDNSPQIQGTIHVDACPKGYFCNTIDKGYSVCCPEGKSCFYNGMKIPHGTVFFDECALCQCIDGAVLCHVDGLLCTSPPCGWSRPYEVGGLTQWCASGDLWAVDTGNCPIGYHCTMLQHGYGVCCPWLFKMCWYRGRFYWNGAVIIVDCHIWICRHGYWSIMWFSICDVLRPLPFLLMEEDDQEAVFCGDIPEITGVNMTIVDRCTEDKFCHHVDHNVAVCVRKTSVINIGGCVVGDMYYLNGAVVVHNDCEICRCSNGQWQCENICDKEVCLFDLPFARDGDGTILCGGPRPLRCPRGYTCTQIEGSEYAACCLDRPDDGCPCPIIPPAAAPQCLLDCTPCEVTSSSICCVSDGYCQIGCTGFVNTLGYCEHDCVFYNDRETRYDTEMCEICTCDRGEWSCILDLDCDPCCLAPDRGPCLAISTRWFFDCAANECKEFKYGGCGGNANNFLTLEQCQMKCEPNDGCPCPRIPANVIPVCLENCSPCEVTTVSVCCLDEDCPHGCTGFDNTAGYCEHDCEFYEDRETRIDSDSCEICTCVSGTWDCFRDPRCGCCLEPDPGTCDIRGDMVTRWYFDCETGECKEFQYSGCGGNVNNFVRKAQCEHHCVECCLDPDPGPCDEQTPAWYYDPRDETCKQFEYGGCEGNNNNYPSWNACSTACREFGKNITCDFNSMTATVRKEWLLHLLHLAEGGASDFHLESPWCEGNSVFNDGHEYFKFQTNLDECGTTSYEVPVEDRIIYSNYVYSQRGSRVIEIECCYDTEYTIAPIHIVANPCSVTVTLKGFGTFNITASLYVTNLFTELFNIDNFPIMVCDGVIIYFGIQLVSNDASLEMFVENCYASESDDPHDPGSTHFPLIVDGCPDDVITVFATGSPHVNHYGWDAYDVVNTDDVEPGEEVDLYIHCAVVVCKLNEIGTRCEQGCLNRGRRGYNQASGTSDSTFITHGPLRKSNNCGN